MRNLIEVLKEVIPIFVGGALIIIGYAIVRLLIVIDFVDKNGNVLWKPVIFSLVIAVIGYFLYRIGEKIWSN